MQLNQKERLALISKEKPPQKWSAFIAFQVHLCSSVNSARFLGGIVIFRAHNLEFIFALLIKLPKCYTTFQHLVSSES